MTTRAHEPAVPERPAATQLYDTPNALTSHYTRFRVAERLLLTGHSHQAWPDCAFDGQRQAWADAAELVDDKWERAFARAQRVRQGWGRLLDDDAESISLGANTHELVVRLLSALPLDQRPRLLTTDGEFHTLRRQLDRLAEERVEVVKAAAEPADTLAERLADSVDDRTALVAVSSVLFQSAKRVPHLEHLSAACQRSGSELLVDVYHELNAIPFSISERRLETAFIVGGGYKYCQLGEGNCFLRLPPACELRPVITGWFAEFDALSEKEPGRVAYGRGAARFAGATYDPTAHYRASEVFDFFAQLGLTPRLLREVSQHQMGLLANAFDALDLDPLNVSRDRDTRMEQLGGFLALRSPQAAEISRRLRECGVHTDYRGDTLRLGPAPYLDDDQLRRAIRHLGASAASQRRP